jgi:hypothetical protein
VVFWGGCQGHRTAPISPPIVTPPPAASPAADVPPERSSENPTMVSSVNRGNQPAVSDKDKASLVYQAKLDLLRILICCDESVLTEGRPRPFSAMQQVVAEYFSNMGFRVLDGSPGPEYSAPPEELAFLANARDVDLFVLLRGVSKPVDKFGEFYSFEVDGRAKVMQISGSELLTTQSALVRGKRALNEEQAAESALKACGEELARKLSDEIVRKSSRGALVRRVRVEGLRALQDADHIRVDLERKPGIRSVTLSGWDQRVRAAVFWVRLDASAKESLGAYLEQLDQIRLQVERLDQTGAATEK